MNSNLMNGLKSSTAQEKEFLLSSMGEGRPKGAFAPEDRMRGGFPARTFPRGIFVGVGLAGILLAMSAYAGSFSKDARGTSAATFLTLPADARSAALGGAVTALDGDAAALTWNPAGLARVEKRAISLSHTPYVDGSSYSNLAYAHRTGGGVIAAGFMYFSAGRIDKTGEGGEDAGHFTPADWAGSVGYARTVGGWSTGLVGKYVTTTVVDSDSTWAMDLGIQAPTVLKERLRFGASLRNAGGDLQLGSTARPLPLEIALGCALFPTGHWTATVDLKFPRDNAPTTAFGVEGRFAPLAQWQLTGRAGWNGDVSSLGDLAGLNLGFGVTRKGWGLDYAFSPLGDLGEVHRLSLKFSFP